MDAAAWRASPRLALEQRLAAVDPHFGAGDMVRGVVNWKDQLGDLFDAAGGGGGGGGGGGRRG